MPMDTKWSLPADNGKTNLLFKKPLYVEAYYSKACSQSNNDIMKVWGWGHQTKQKMEQNDWNPKTRRKICAPIYRNHTTLKPIDSFLQLILFTKPSTDSTQNFIPQYSESLLKIHTYNFLGPEIICNNFNTNKERGDYCATTNYHCSSTYYVCNNWGIWFRWLCIWLCTIEKGEESWQKRHTYAKYIYSNMEGTNSVLTAWLSVFSAFSSKQLTFSLRINWIVFYSQINVFQITSVN